METSNQYLETEPVGKLMARYSVPCIISLLVGALYNIVDQIFIVLMAVYLIFQNQIISMFGGTVNEETFAYSQEYFFYITLGIPFYMFGQAMNPIIRADGSPGFAMVSTLAQGCFMKDF